MYASCFVMVSNDSKSKTVGSLFFQPSGNDLYSLKKSVAVQAVNASIVDKATNLKRFLLLFVIIWFTVWVVSVVFIRSFKILFSSLIIIVGTFCRFNRCIVRRNRSFGLIILN